jgi:hypothetical protein
MEQPYLKAKTSPIKKSLPLCEAISALLCLPPRKQKSDHQRRLYEYPLQEYTPTRVETKTFVYAFIFAKICL